MQKRAETKLMLKYKLKISGRPRKSRTMDNVWRPSGLERLFFSTATTISENILVRKQTFMLILQIGRHKNDCGSPAFNPVLFTKLANVSHAFMFWNWIYSKVDVSEVFFQIIPPFPLPQFFWLLILFAHLVPQLQTPAEQNDCRAHDAHYLRWGGLEEKPCCWHRCVLTKNREVVCSCEHMCRVRKST